MVNDGERVNPEVERMYNLYCAMTHRKEDILIKKFP